MRIPFGPALACLALVGATVAAACGDDDDPTDPAEETNFTAQLTGAKERPNPVTTTATGTATITINNNSIAFSVNVTGLSGPATMAHIHGPATTEQAADVIVGFTGLSTATSGLLASGTITTTGVATISLDSLKTLIRNGRAYVNVHTAANPPGEVRGQIVPQ